ncbi:hypothetical protein L228DRAFT_50418 [Xylona heveae TC161]|uniref:DUF7908 domain-containing protein n=1 Tax=Xylona heveae (strain CBS 132557 / TC161) TaxID=1328760 RepID=A0A164ZMY5_XYLHT|nr:hypothetical protein L228DRAFT_50418 [Xylona heveae TC161]KZF19295.1 hypothetical protein L228DRAFT_50418 [Xylona heveae TC161]
MVVINATPAQPSGVVRRQAVQGSYISANGSTVSNCQDGVSFQIVDGQLFGANGLITTTAGTASQPLVGVAEGGEISRTWKYAGTSLVWSNPLFENGVARFCSQSDGLVIVVLQGDFPSGCNAVTLSGLEVSNCPGYSSSSLPISSTSVPPTSSVPSSLSISTSLSSKSFPSSHSISISSKSFPSSHSISISSKSFPSSHSISISSKNIPSSVSSLPVSSPSTSALPTFAIQGTGGVGGIP